MTELRPARAVAADIWHAESTINGDGTPLVEADRREAQAVALEEAARDLEANHFGFPSDAYAFAHSLAAQLRKRATSRRRRG